MKTLLSLLLSCYLILGTCYSLNAQWVTIPDSNFVNWLNANIPQCMNGNQMDTTCPGVVNRVTVNCANYQTLIYIRDLNGIQYFDNLDSLDCSGHLLLTLPRLPLHLVSLKCYSNYQLNSLPQLPQSLNRLECDGNQLTSLPALPAGLEVLYCHNNQLTSLPALPPNLQLITCRYNQLTTLPELPDFVSNLDCSFNFNLTCLPRLKRIYQFNFQGTAITCLPNYGNVTNSTPPLNSLPICDSANANSCTVFVWNISGTVATETGTPIPGVTVMLSGGRSETTTTLSDGSYSFLVDRDGDYTVTPSKSNDITTNNGITSTDMLQIRRHILGLLPLPSPYKIIAADVDGSGTVTTLDILLTRQMILQMTTTFPNGRLWSFVPSDHVFADMQNPFPFPTTRTYTNLQQSVTGQDFIGIKLGDVNGSWDAGIP